MIPMLITFMPRQTVETPVAAHSRWPGMDIGNYFARIFAGAFGETGLSRHLTVIVAFALLLVIATRASGDESLQEKMTRGLLAEEAQQDLKAAATAYAEVVRISDQQRDLAASALFRLADVQRRLGQTNEALANYRRLVNEFQGYSNLVAAAAKYLPGTVAKPSTPKSEQEQLLAEEIVIAERSLEEVRKRQVAGVTGSEEVYKAEREILKLKREMVALRASGMSADLLIGPATASGVPDDEQLEIERLEKMIANSPDLVNAVGENGYTPLIAAAAKDQPKVLEFLLSHGADVNGPGKNGWTPAAMAASSGHKRNIEILIKAGANIDGRVIDWRNPLHEAVANGHILIVEFLLNSGVSVEKYATALALIPPFEITPLGLAVLNNSPELIDLLARHGAGMNTSYVLKTSRDLQTSTEVPRTPLGLAIAHKKWKAAVALLRLGADPNPDTVPLLIWCGDAPLPLLDELLGRGCNINGVGPNGRTPITSAVAGMYPTLVKWLVSHGVNQIPAEGSGETPLISALRNHFNVPTRTPEERMELIDALIGAKQAINTPSPDGTTPLIFAIEHVDESLVTKLLDAGANPNRAKPDGISPITTALLKIHKSKEIKLAILKKLLEAGADPNVGQAGEPAIFMAVGEYEDPQIIKLLLDHHANPNVRDAVGQTPLDLIRFQIGGKGTFLSPQDKASPGRSGTIEKLLIDAGAKDDFPDPNTIRVSRRASHQIYAVFRRQGTNDLNRFTLLELLAVHYGVLRGPDYFVESSRIPGASVPLRSNLLVRPVVAGNGTPSSSRTPFYFPDWNRGYIERLTSDQKGTTQVRLNAERIAISTGRVGDVRLEWGDIVELPESDHPLDAKPGELPGDLLLPFEMLLPRDIKVSLGGRVSTVTERLKFIRDPNTKGENSSSSSISLVSATTVPAPGVQDVFTLAALLRTPGLVRVSSDLTKVVVRRSTTQNGPIDQTVDCSNPGSGGEIWLGSGDQVIIP